MRYFLLLFLFSCTLVSEGKKPDQLDQLISRVKDGDRVKLEESFGVGTFQELIDGSQVYRYTGLAGEFDVFIDSASKKITAINYFFWKDFDNYEYLKDKFKGFSWIEKEVKQKSHYVSDLRAVSIPEHCLYFEYDDLSPKRKIFVININCQNLSP